MVTCFGPSGKCQRTAPCRHACDLRVQYGGAVEMGTALINGMPYRRPVIRVAVVTVDGTSCTVPVGELLAVIEDGGPYTVQIKTIPVREFEAMPEFQGW